MQRLSIVVLIVAALGCGYEAKSPPLELSFRDSLVGAGKVVQIKNTSNTPLAGLRIEFHAPSGEERTFEWEKLEAYGTVEIGWKKLGGWQVVEGTEIDVRCDGFMLPFSGKIE